MIFSIVDPKTNQALVFPVAPEEVQIQIEAKTTVVSPLDLGDIELQRGRQPFRISWNSFLPGPLRQLPGVQMPISANEMVKQIESWITDSIFEKKLRLVITDVINIPVTLRSFEPTPGGGHGDIQYSISFTEWRELTVQEFGEKRQTVTASSVSSVSNGQSQTYTVKAGDSLWKIAKRMYNNGSEWRRIYEANTDKIDNPDIIYPGQVLAIP